MRTIGKNRGLARLADADGHFRMVALDQRPPLFDAIAKAKGITREQVEYSDVTAAKRLLVENLAPHCSSMLFDPNFAVPAAIDLLPPRCGLIMTLEEHRVEETAGGRKSRAITNWSVEKIRAMGGDAVKVLAWYRPDADAAVNEHQKRFVREIGEDCARHDIPYVLELLVYPFLGSANHTADYVESPGKLPGLVIESVREFAKPEYGVDLLKLESPLAANSLPARDGSAEAKAAQKEFDAIGDICRAAQHPLGAAVGRRRAWTSSSACWITPYAAGAGGFLAGRTIWLDAVLKNFSRTARAAGGQPAQGWPRRTGAAQRAHHRQGTHVEARFPVFTDIKQEGDFARAY